MFKNLYKLLEFLIDLKNKIIEWRVPDAPKNFRAKSNAPEEMTLWWEPPASADDILVRGYTLSYGIESSTQKVVLEGANTNSFTVTGLCMFF